MSKLSLLFENALSNNSFIFSLMQLFTNLSSRTSGYQFKMNTNI